MGVGKSDCHSGALIQQGCLAFAEWENCVQSLELAWMGRGVEGEGKDLRYIQAETRAWRGRRRFCSVLRHVIRGGGAFRGRDATIRLGRR